ncbi:MAG: hypothetical protein U5L72_00335 [Bacteroidales bacterium]|nr:hypothetical protein [Bacteroidales bacterium]
MNMASLVNSPPGPIQANLPVKYPAMAPNRVPRVLIIISLPEFSGKRRTAAIKSVATGNGHTEASANAPANRIQ